MFRPVIIDVCMSVLFVNNFLATFFQNHPWNLLNCLSTSEVEMVNNCQNIIVKKRTLIKDFLWRDNKTISHNVKYVENIKYILVIRMYFVYHKSQKNEHIHDIGLLHLYSKFEL